MTDIKYTEKLISDEIENEKARCNILMKSTNGDCGHR